MFDTKQELVNYLKKNNNNVIDIAGMIDILINSILKFDLLDYIVDRRNNFIDDGTFGIDTVVNTFVDTNLNYLSYRIVCSNKIYYTKIIKEVRIRCSNVDEELSKILIKTDYFYKLTILPKLPKKYTKNDILRQYKVVKLLIKKEITLPNNVMLKIIIFNKAPFISVDLIIEYLILNFINGNSKITFNDKAIVNDTLRIRIMDALILRYSYRGEIDSLRALREVIENGQLINVNVDMLHEKSKKILLGLNTSNIKSAMTIE